MNKNPDSQGFLSYLMSKDFLKQLLVIIGGLLLLIFVIQLWLRFYTNHGQKLELPKYIGKNIDDVVSYSASKSDYQN